MRTYNNDIKIRRGETFTMSKRFENRDKSPYIISSKLINPYFRITVSNTRYQQAGRYVHNRFLSLSRFPRFYLTRAVNINDIPTETGGEGYQSFINMPLPAGYEGDETSGYANIAVFYSEKNGNKSYKYWIYNNKNENDFSGYWADYNCVITTQFGNKLTNTWLEQNYYYSIDLVSGPDVPNEINFVVPILSNSTISVLPK